MRPTEPLPRVRVPGGIGVAVGKESHPSDGARVPDRLRVVLNSQGGRHDVEGQARNRVKRGRTVPQRQPARGGDQGAAATNGAGSVPGNSAGTYRCGETCCERAATVE